MNADQKPKPLTAEDTKAHKGRENHTHPNPRWVYPFLDRCGSLRKMILGHRHASHPRKLSEHKAPSQPSIDESYISRCPNYTLLKSIQLRVHVVSACIHQIVCGWRMRKHSTEMTHLVT